MTKAAIAVATALVIGVASAAYAAEEVGMRLTTAAAIAPARSGTFSRPVPTRFDHPRTAERCGYVYQAGGKRNRSR